MFNHIDLTRGARSPHLRLLLADGCNLRCTYCHFHATQQENPAPANQRAARRVMPAETASAAIHAFAAAMLQRGEAHFDLSLYGGEPLINPKALEAALLAVEAVRAAGLSVAAIVNTNATLVDPTIAARLAQAGARAHVSLDGTDLASNSQRRLHSGAASLSAVMRGLSALQLAGVRMQLNVVLSESNLAHLAGLMPLARQVGCDQVFFAMPDEASGCAISVEQSLPALLEARVAAQRVGLRAIGPWTVGLRAPAAAADLPLNLIVRPDSQAFVPHLPQRLFAGIDDLLAAEHWDALAQSWRKLRATCQGCELDARCRGYLKMMTRYHAGMDADAGAECELARKAATMLKDSRHQMLRTALLMHAEPAADGEFSLHHPQLAGDAIEVSSGVLELLEFFLPGATPAAAAQAFEVDEESGGAAFDESLAVLRSHGLVRAADGADDLQRFSQLLGSRGDVDSYAGLLVGVVDAELMIEARKLRPHLEAAIQRMPLRLQPNLDRCCIFLAADAQAFGDAAGLPVDAPWREWMAGTIANGVLVLNQAACAAVLSHGGRARLRAFEQQLAHELLHLCLRQRGLCLPVWLQEGLCEALSGAPLDDARLREAMVHADAFAEFVKACMAAPAAIDSRWTLETALLRFSGAPVDENPGYALAHDLVRQLIAELGVDGLLDALAKQGLRGRWQPFPLQQAGAGMAGLELAAMLDHWRDGLRQRAGPETAFLRPMRVVTTGRHALVYNRIVGGHAWIDDGDAAQLEGLAGRNLEVDEVAVLLADQSEAIELLPGWRAGQLARQRGYHLRLTLEGGCNMSCSYCYEGEKKRQAMSIETADQAVAAWRDLLEPGDLPGSTIRMFGGEPFMNWPVMKHVFETATIGLPEGSVSWYVNTNGTLIRDEHVAFLAGIGPNLLVHLSMDGVAAVNDRDRIFNNQRGTFEYVDRAARRLIGAAVPLNISVTLTPHNAHGLPDLLRHVAGLRELNPDASLSIAIKPVIGPDLALEDARHMQACLEAALAQGKLLGLDVGGEPLRAANLLFQDSTPTGHFCGVGGRELYVTPEGKLMVCHAMQGSEYSNLTEVAQAHRIPVPADVAQRHAGHVNGCSGCEVEGLCGGGCMAQSKQATGSISNKPSDYFCMMMQSTFRNAVQQQLQARAGL